MENFLYDYIVYSDGGYSMKHNVGAFAFVIVNSKEEVVCRFAKKIENETNNRAELKGIIAGLHCLPKEAKYIQVVSDSQYALNTCSGLWGRNANQDLFPILDKIVNERGLKVEYKWVRGHNGNLFNEMCDIMCNEASGVDLNAEYQIYKKYKR